MNQACTSFESQYNPLSYLVVYLVYLVVIYTNRAVLVLSHFSNYVLSSNLPFTRGLQPLERQEVAEKRLHYTVYFETKKTA